MVTVRRIGPDEWAVWRSLRLAALAEAPYAFSARLAEWQGQQDREARWRDRLGVRGAYNVVALLDEEPAGMASGVPAAEKGTAEVFSMWVAPTERGRGVGDALLAELERWARQIGARVLRLSVAEGNRAAARLYERNGFRFTGEQEVTADGQRELVMVKVVAPPPGSVARLDG